MAQRKLTQWNQPYREVPHFVDLYFLLLIDIHAALSGVVWFSGKIYKIRE